MSENGQLDADLAELFDDVFGTWRDARGTATLELDLDRALWATLDETGISRLTAVEGAGASWVEAAGLLRAAARAAAPLPIAENDLLSGWLREQAGIEDDGLVHSAAEVDGSGRAAAVPWASQVDRVTLLWAADGGWKAADVAASDLTITPGRDLAGQPRDAIVAALSTVDAKDVSAEVAREFRLRGALARAVQMNAAMGRMVELAVEHATSRVQFGRPIGKFQAVQNQIADAASEVAISDSATAAAVLLAASEEVDLDRLELAIAVARSVAGHAASTVVRNVHQVHGAIGTTFEHQLHEFSKPVLAWRSEFGTVREWDSLLTDKVVASGDGLWSFGVESDA